MNLLFLFNFVLRQAAFGLVIGSPNLPVLDNGDVSGKFETINLSLTINLQRFSSTISNYKIFSFNEHAIMQTTHHEGEMDREAG